MVHSSLLPTGLPVFRIMWIAGFHGHTETCPIVEITLYYLQEPQKIQVAQVKRLPYAALLGRDVPAFQDLVASFLQKGSEAPAQEAAQ